MLDPKELESRLASFEEQLAVSAANEQTLARAVRTLGDRLAAITSDRLGSLLEPGALPTQRSGSLGASPDMGQAGLERLRNDPWMSTAQGLTTPFTGTGNLLVDPTFETNYYDATDTAYLGDLLNLTTSYQDLGPNWEVKITESGVSSDTATALPAPYDRLSTDVVPQPGYGASSANVRMTLDWAGSGATGTTAVYLKPSQGFTPLLIAVRTHLVASARLVVDSIQHEDGEPTSWEAWVEITNAAGTVLATGDTVNLLQVADGQDMPIVHVALESPDYTGATEYFARYVMQVVTGTRTGDMFGTVAWLEPTLNLADEDAPMSFQPAIGAWAPYFLRSVNVTDEAAYSGIIFATVTADKNNYAPTGWQTCSHLVLNPDAARSITGFAAPTNGVWGTEKVISNIDSAFAITLVHASGSSDASNQIYGPSSANITIAPRGGVTLRWHPDDSAGNGLRWRLVSGD